MKKILLTILGIAYISSCYITTSYSVDSVDKPNSNEILTADSLNKTIYDALLPYVYKHTPFFEQSHDIQQQIANNNLGGLLKLFTVAIDQVISGQVNTFQESRRGIQNKFSELSVDNKRLKEQINILKNQINMLTTQVINMQTAMKDNPQLQERQKYGGKN